MADEKRLRSVCALYLPLYGLGCTHRISGNKRGYLHLLIPDIVVTSRETKKKRDETKRQVHSGGGNNNTSAVASARDNEPCPAHVEQGTQGQGNVKET